MDPRPEPFTLCHVENSIWVLTSPTGIRAYDYEFSPRFRVQHPALLTHEITAIARMGATADYPARYQGLLQLGIRLIHSPEIYQRTSLLPQWAPLLGDLTPRSRCYTTPPTAAEVELDFSWPVFVKGERQTHKHKKSLSVAESPAQFESIMAQWLEDPILRWQSVVVREWIPLRRVGISGGDQLPVAFEFRSFWYKQQCVGIGPYWTSSSYALTPRERNDALAVGHEAARRIDVPFAVIDLAQRDDGRWLVIECNDAQDAGYAGVDRVALWQSVIAIDRL